MHREYPEVQQLIFQEEINNLETFGVTKGPLLQANARVLKYMFRGIHDLNIPRGMWEYLNPEEGLAIYFRITPLKESSLKSAPQELMKLIPYLNKQAWADPRFAHLSHQFEHPFSRMPGSQKPRLEKIAPEDVDNFLSSVFDDPLKIPYTNADHFEGDYYDPNGGLYEYAINKKLYVNPIYNHIKSIYQSKE